MNLQYLYQFQYPFLKEYKHHDDYVISVFVADGYLFTACDNGKVQMFKISYDKPRMFYIPYIHDFVREFTYIDDYNGFCVTSIFVADGYLYTGWFNEDCGQNKDGRVRIFDISISRGDSI